MDIGDTMPNARPADAIPDSWVERMPAVARPYLRLMRADRPIGSWLLGLPCWVGLSLAAADGFAAWSLFWLALLFAIGAFVMRGAGCVYNDIVDRDFDAKVARTALRPIPAGQVTVRQAVAFMVVLCFIGLAVLVQFNRLAILIGLSALALVAIYPFMKRITYWPQAWLGLTFNWGVLVAYAAAAGTLSATALIAYAACLCWTLGYDTVYALQDSEDDALAGVKSTALKFGETSRQWIAGFYGLTILGFGVAGFVADYSLFYFLGLAPAAAHFVWQVRRLDMHDGHNCLMIFKSNREAGLLLAAAPVCEALHTLL